MAMLQGLTLSYVYSPLQIGVHVCRHNILGQLRSG